MNIPVIYEDQWLLVVDKPAGLLTVPTPRGELRTLTSILNDDALKRNVEYRLHPCHRLDRETSGLVVYAKGKSAQKTMMQLFNERRVQKKYLAFAQGRVHPATGTIRFPLEHRPAQTNYQVREQKKQYSIVEVQPVTGRTNQVRIHFKMIQHPLVGETRFAFRKDFALRAKRVCLHAAELMFPHPITHQSITLHAPVPQDMEQFMESHS